MANSGMKIDDLVINIKVNSEGAVSAINKVAGSLGTVQGAASGAKTDMQGFADSEKQTGEQGEKADKGVKGVAKSVKQAGKEAKKSSGFFGGLIRTIGRIAMYRLIRSAIRGVTTAFTEGTKTFIEWDRTYNKGMAGAAKAVDRITAKWGQLKKAIGAFSGVFITAIEPVLQKIMDAVINIFNFMQQAIRALQGEATWYRAVYKEAKNTTKEAQKLQRVLFGFDELNVLPSQNSSSSSSSAGKWDYVEEMIPKENPFVEAGKFYGSDKPIERFFLAAAFTARNIIAWVGENITKPIIDWFKQKIGPAIKSVWDAGKGAFVDAYTWIKDGVLDVIRWIGRTAGTIWDALKTVWNAGKQSVVDAFTWIKDIAVGAWNGIKSVWTTVVTWFTEKVLTPLKTTFSNAWDKIKGFFNNPLESIKNAWKSLKTWFGESVADPIKEKFKVLREKLGQFLIDPVSAIKEAWKSLKTWFKEKVTDPISEAWKKVTKLFGEGGVNFQEIKDGIKNAFKSAINSLIKGINSVIRKPLEKVNEIIEKIRDTDIFGWKPFSGLKTISIPQIQPLAMAQGGVIPNTGTLFQAGEAGPEVVANLGTHTGVMNVGQMQEAVAEGNEAVVNAIYTLINAVNGKDMNVYLDSRKIGESVTRYQNNQARRGVAQVI